MALTQKYFICQSNSIELLISELYTCQLSHLQAENFILMPTHASGPNSHVWMKNVSYNSLNWNTVLKDVYLRQFDKRKLHVIEKVNEYRTALTRNLKFL